MSQGIVLQAKTLTVIEFLADGVVCFAAVLIAWSQVFGHGVPLPDIAELAPQMPQWAAGVALVMSLLFSFAGVYRRGTTVAGIWTSLRRALLALVIGAAIALMALVLRGRVNSGVMVLGWAVLYLAIGAFIVRGLVQMVRNTSVGLRRILVVGTGDEARDVARDIGVKARSSLVGFYPAGTDSESNGLSNVFSRTLTIDEVARKHRVNEIVVAVREQRGGGVQMSDLLACRIRGVRVLDLAGFYEKVHSEVPTDSLKASWLVYGHGFVQSRARRFFKRCFDIVFSSILLVLASPVMLLAVLAIRLESSGPIFYRQERVGLGGRPLMCRKFRSMRTDAEKDGVARWAVKGDSRITRVGRVIRKTRIDELPQLLSVLFGDMSLVGPRPERPSFVAELRQSIPFYDIRHSVKPGVTGWAQVRYGYCATMDDSKRKHQFDLYYVKNNSLMLDLLVLIETVSVVLFREGAQ